MNQTTCTCDNPFCGEEHAPYVPAPIGIYEETPDDSSGPDQEGLGYSERDDEAYYEMVREDMAGLR